MFQTGISLERLCEEAHAELVLVAPFAKELVLRRLLAIVGSQVAVTCVTRWRPEEIVAGVSDISVWGVLRERNNARLMLRADLHAKYYRSDSTCLVGSANLTSSALGWTIHPNLEILTPIDIGIEKIRSMEATILAGCVEVDDSLALEMERLVSGLPNIPYPAIDECFAVGENVSAEIDRRMVGIDQWLPTLRYPELLYCSYLGKADRMSGAAEMSANADLSTLNPPPFLPEGAFNNVVGGLMLQMPIIRRVDKLLATPQRFGAVRDLLGSLNAEEVTFDPNLAWQTLMRWLLHFIPNRYALAVPRHSEVMYRLDSGNN